MIGRAPPSVVGKEEGYWQFLIQDWSWGATLPSLAGF